MPLLINASTWKYDETLGIYKRVLKVTEADVDSLYHRLYKMMSSADPNNVFVYEGRKERHKQSKYSQKQKSKPSNTHSKLANETGIVRLSNFQIENSEGKSWYSISSNYEDIHGNVGIIRISDHPLSEKTWCEKTKIDHGIDIVIPQKPNHQFKELQNLQGVRNTLTIYQYVYPEGPHMSKNTFKEIQETVESLLSHELTYTPGMEIGGVEGQKKPSRPINESLTNDVLLHVTEGNYSDSNYYRTSFPSGYGCVISKGRLTDVFYFDIRPINMSNRFEVYASSFIAQSVDFGSSSKGYNFRLKDPIKNDIWKDVPEMRIFLNKNHKKSSMDRGAISVSPYGAENNNILTEYVMDLFENTGFFILKKHNHRFNLV